MSWNIGKLFRREAGDMPAGGDAQEGRAVGGSYASRPVYAGDAHSSLAVSAWYRGLAVKAETFAQLVLEYQRRVGKSYELYTRGYASTLNFLIQVQPNPLMTASNLLREAAIHREVYGNAVIYVERDFSGDVRALWLCSTASLNIITMEYSITYNRPGGPVSKIVDSEDVIHWRNTYSYDNGLTGMPTLTYAAQSLSIAATNDKQALDIAAKGGKYKILVQEDRGTESVINLLSKEQRDGQRDQLQKGLDEGLDVISLSGLVSPTILSMDSQQMQLLENRRFDTNAVARFLGVPLVLLFEYQNNTYKAPEQAMLAFLQHTIAPMANDVEAEFNAKLVGPSAYPTLRFHFNEEALMSLDPKGKMELYKLQLECGIRSVNELREVNNLPNIGKHGDRYLVSTNLQPLDELKVGKNQAEPSENGKSKTDNSNGEEGGEQ